MPVPEKGQSQFLVDRTIRGLLDCGLIGDCRWVADSVGHLLSAGVINRVYLSSDLSSTLELDLLMGGETLNFRLNMGVTEVAFDVVPGQATCQYQVSSRLTRIRYDSDEKALILSFGEFGGKQFDYRITRNVDQTGSGLEVKQPFTVVPTVVRK